MAERVTKARARELKTSLLPWRPIDEAKLLLTRMSEPHGFYAASQGNMQFWREAHCGCVIGQLAGANAIRLCEPDPPDFELRFDGRTIRFELVEIRDPDQRIGDEFNEAAEREARGEKQLLEKFDTDGHRLWLRDRLSQSLSSKAAKQYDQDVCLAIFIHAWIFEGQRKEVDADILSAVAPHVGSFPAIWVYSSDQLIRIDKVVQST